MHKNAMDVCIEIVRHRYIGDDYSIWHVRIWNLGYTGNPWYIDEEKNYKIKSDQYDSYREISDKELLKPRREG